MKNIWLGGVLCVLSAQFVSQALGDEPANLEAALEGYHWSWTHSIPEGKKSAGQKDKEVQFFKDGTAVTTFGDHWRWTILGPRTVKVIWSAQGPEEPSTIQELDTTFSKNIPKNIVRMTRLQPAQATVQVASASPPPPIQAMVYKPEQSQIQILKDQGPNISSWITSPLATAVPPEIGDNLLFMREELRDEQASKPAASAEAYSSALRYVSALLRDVEKRKEYEAKAGGDAVLHPHSNLTEYRRDHLTWPQYALEREERAERHEQPAYAAAFIANKGPVQWEAENQRMRRELTGFYVEFRQHLRETAKP